MPARIQAVSFDVGGTLLEPWPSVGQVYADLAAQHGSPGMSADVLNHRFEAAWKSRGIFRHTRSDWAAIVDRTFAGLVEVPPSASFFPMIYRRFADPEVWRIHDDVLPALDLLAGRGIRLAVISNWDERLAPLLRALHLERHFAAILVSGTLGCEKPSPGIFAAAARELALPASAILHVGDSLTEDYEGATAAGLQARWLQRGPALPLASGQEHRVASLGELAAIAG